MPDETTHCRFRNALVKAGVFDELLAEVCRQIEGHGLKLREAKAAENSEFATMIEGPLSGILRIPCQSPHKAYASKANRAALKGKYRDGIGSGSLNRQGTTQIRVRAGHP